MRHQQAQPHATLHHLIQGNPIIMSTAIVKRQAIRAVGGFDEANRYGTDDYELWLRLAAAGYKFHYVDEVLASYRIHGSNASLHALRMRDGGVHALRQARLDFPSAFGRAEIHSLHEGLRNLDFNAGWYLYNNGQYGQALRYFLRAVRHKPLRAKQWLYLLATSLPFRKRLLPKLRGMLAATGDTGQSDRGNAKGESSYDW